jgi:glucokinase-like ROK family protein
LMKKNSYNQPNKQSKEIAILNTIREYGPISRTKIAKIFKLSAATITKYINGLIQAGIVEEDGWEPSKGGRMPVLLRIIPEATYAIGVDLGGANLRVVVVNLESNIVAKITKKTNADEGRDKVFRRVIDAIYEAIEHSKIEKEKIKGIGMGISGLIDHQRGVSLYCPNIEGWENVPVKRLVEEEFAVDTSVEDSSRAMALAEHWSGVARGIDNFIFVNVGVGIGCAIFIHGKLYRGTGGIAGEFGHITIDEAGPRCNCGNCGCLETLASGPAISRRARQAIKEGVVSLIEKLAEGKLENITPEIVVEATKRGDKLAFNIMEKTGEYLGIGIADMINIFNPELIVIGAGVSQAGDILLEPLKRAVKARALQLSSSMTNIKVSQLGDNAGALGAAIMVLKDIFSPL